MNHRAYLSGENYPCNKKKKKIFLIISRSIKFFLQVSGSINYDAYHLAKSCLLTRNNISIPTSDVIPFISDE